MGERGKSRARYALRERVWGGLARVFEAAAPLGGRLSGRPAADLVARRTAPAAMAAWSGRARDMSRPLVWLHGASAGELAGATPVLQQLRRRVDLQLAVTCGSAAAVPAACALAPDWAGRLPFDAPSRCAAALEALLPDVLVFAKRDVWPVLSASAALRGVGLALVNAVVAPDGSRLRGPARWLLGPAYRRLDRVGAASDADAERLRRLGVRRDALRVTGDAAADPGGAAAAAGAGLVAEAIGRRPLL